MSSPDKYDTIIEAVNGGYGREATRLLKPVPARTRPRARSHPVVWFAAGLVLWQLNGILLYLFLWLLLHG